MAVETTQRKIPRSALCFAADFTSGEQSPQENGTTLFPFDMLARTTGVANHPYWGRCIHDFSGMQQSKASVSVDYCHNAEEVIGYSDKIELQADGLRMAGALVSLKEGDRAWEVAGKRKAGVPYETSIMTNWEGLMIEWVPEGYQAQVNNQTVDGPITIFRQWDLWGVAVCPYGSDSKTSVNFSAGLSGEVSVSVKGPVMSTANPSANAPAKTGQDYLNTFGQKAGLWFAQGKSWDECFGLFAAEAETESKEKDSKITELSGKITELSAQLDAAKAEYAAEVDKLKGEHDSEINALKEQFSAHTGGSPLSGTPPTGTAGLKLPLDNVAKFAASIKMPGGKTE